MPDMPSFGRRTRTQAARPAPEIKPAAEPPDTRPAAGTSAPGLGVSVDMMLWAVFGLLVVAWFVLPDLDHKQWAVWAMYAAGGVSLLNTLRPRKK